MASGALLLGGCEPVDGEEPRKNWLIDTEEAWAQLQLVVPMVLTNLSYYAIPLIGLSGALETLCGQAHGARLYRMLGLYLQSSLLLSAAASALISVVWLFTEPLLLLLGQEAEVSRAAAVFIRYQIPGLFAFAFLQCAMRYLQTQSVVLPLVACSALPLALHVVLNHLLVNVLGLGLAGASASISATYCFSCVLLLVYVMWWSRELDATSTWEGFSVEAFNYVLPTMRLAAPSAVMVCLECWAFELLVLIAGWLPNSTVSTPLMAMCVSTEAIAYMVTYGFSAAVSTRVSNEIGAGNVDKAKNAVAVTLKLSVFLALSFFLLLALGHGLWASLFTGSDVIAAEFAALTPFIIVSVLLDSTQGVLSACRNLQNCAAEVAACDEGLKLALNWSTEPIELEMDCVSVVNTILSKGNDQCSLVHLIQSIKEGLEEREIIIQKVERSQNEAGDIMAKLGRESRLTQFWIGSFPEVLDDIIRKDCNSVII